jgi:thymidylate kinase
MIIELFGPPAAGKTTFARNLAAALESSGKPVQLCLSVRPAETIEHGDGGPSVSARFAAMRRFTRPTLELLTCIGQTGGLASELLHLLPPSSFAWSVRLRQYITHLERSWRLAERANATVIFDQGFVQAVCSLVLLVRNPDTSAVEKALTLIPKPDQWIRVDAPRHLLRDRLEARRRAQSWIEQRLEFDTETSLRAIEVFRMLDSSLRRCCPRIAQIGPEAVWRLPALLDGAQARLATTKPPQGPPPR